MGTAGDGEKRGRGRKRRDGGMEEERRREGQRDRWSMPVLGFSEPLPVLFMSTAVILICRFPLHPS